MKVEEKVGIEISFKQQGKQTVLKFQPGKIRIGRRSDCDVVIENASVSRLHATVDHEDGRWVLRDNDSVNGLEIGGRMVKTHTLGNDRVRMGDVTVVFHAETTVDIGSEVLDRAQKLTSSIAVDNLDTLLHSVLQEGDGEQTAFRERAEASLDAKQIIHILSAATDALIAHDNLDSILEKVLDQVFEHLPVNQASILLFDEDKNCLKPRLLRAAEGRSPDQIRMSRNIADAAITSKKAVLVLDAEEDPRFNAAASVVSLGIHSAICAPMCHKGRVVGLIYVDRRARNVFTRTHLEVLSILAGLSAAAVQRALLQSRIAREKNIRERLSRYHAPAVIDHIVRANDLEANAMAAEEREVTVLFADIVGFTSLSENLPAREVTELLNEVFEALTEEVFLEGGTLDKFIGDAVMVFFGAPLPQPDHAFHGVRAALAMQRRIAQLNAERGDRPRIGLRIGVNTGPAVVGDVGARQRKDYTIIGDTVNTACRLESDIAEEGQVVIGPGTYERVAAQCSCQPLEEVQLKGRVQPTQPWLVVGLNED